MKAAYSRLWIYLYAAFAAWLVLLALRDPLVLTARELVMPYVVAGTVWVFDCAMRLIIHAVKSVYRWVTEWSR